MQARQLERPIDDGATDLPRLLRRVADHIHLEGIGATEVMDLTVSEEMTEHGAWWSVTVYWAPSRPADKGEGEGA
ncbi:hypothetical protein [uncultured Pseudokineococcus sp.]|uniref:hypothetical protein n=1 Tax=uncultured Pseudokineococcus sp. TaxID=1642928 RepID=UPI0026162187|nr:hypothetical protein [uncultured Pseudokineococcus sp.]